MTVWLIGPRDARDPQAINTTSRSTGWSRGLSPFLLGPVNCYGGLVAQNVENAWQYSKVYKQHLIPDGEPSDEWFKWRDMGFARYRADRYPMGKGAIPEYSWWDGKRLSYIEARQEIYIPIYAAAVKGTSAFEKLKRLYEQTGELTLWDFDAYQHRALGMSYEDVILSETRKMGHAFVLAMMLEGLI